jgi:hypothetical protein
MVQEEKKRPGDPENNASAGTTVFGGTIVLSAIFAQSLMIVNFPSRVCLSTLSKQIREESYNNTVLPNFNMVADLSSFYDRVGTYVNMVANLHWIVVEISAICFIWWPVHSFV